MRFVRLWSAPQTPIPNLEPDMKSAISTLALVISLLCSTIVISVPAVAADAVAPAAKSDSDITKDVEKALAAEPTLKDQKITVTTKTNEKGEKEVTLKGVVTDQQMMVSAGLAAEKTPGVKYVMNEIDPEDYLREIAAKK